VHVTDHSSGCEIRGSPFVVECYPSVVDFSLCTVEGDGIASAMAGVRADLRITAKDKGGHGVTDATFVASIVSAAGDGSQWHAEAGSAVHDALIEVRHEARSRRPALSRRRVSRAICCMLHVVCCYLTTPSLPSPAARAALSP
jgi:hypothetical protein